MSNYRIRPLVAAACVTALVRATPLAQPTTAPAATATTDIPFDFRTKQPIVPAQVNGGPAVPFVVNTGASIHVVDRELARQVNVAKGRDVNWHGGGEATVSAQVVDDVILAFGGRTWAAQRAGDWRKAHPDWRGNAASRVVVPCCIDGRIMNVVGRNFELR